MIKKTYVYDLETLDIFSATFVDKDSDETFQFVISNRKDQRNELFGFLNTKVAALIGYNCLTFDAQVLEYLYRNPQATAQEIRQYATIVIQEDNRKPDVPEWKLRIPHLDLFKALSLSTSAKRTSLKWCEFQLDMDNIIDMPSKGKGDNWEETVLSYNLNDVLSTKKLYLKYYYEIELRKSISKQENISLINCTEPDMAKKLFSKHLSIAMGINTQDLREMGTKRDVVAVKDIIFPYVQFKTSLLQNVKQQFESLLLKPDDSFNVEVNFGGINTVYALGGIHGALNKKIIESNDMFIIKSLDVVSFYPNLMIRNKLHPEHLPQEVFCKLYEGYFNERRKIPKSDPRNYILKILLNATYGLTNDKYSFLRDRQVTLAICVNGQLLLSMLFEELLLNIPNSKLLMLNTDGGEIYIPRQYEDKYYDICKQWEQKTNLELEFVDYKKLIIENVNNYIGIYSNGKTKTKGRFEFENIPLHKNKSHSIIPRAIFEYFVNGKDVEETIKTSTNIFDFCGGVKGKKGIKFVERVFNGAMFIDKPLQKVNRYIVSNNGNKLIKILDAMIDEEGNNKKDKLLKYRKENSKQLDIFHFLPDVTVDKDRESEVEAGWKCTILNDIGSKNIEDYDLNYDYYITKANNIINEIEEL